MSVSTVPIDTASPAPRSRHGGCVFIIEQEVGRCNCPARQG
jgi:hypothetical protein